MGLSNYFSGKTIWITGASSGIGKALALTLTNSTCKLILSARNEKKLLELQTKCENLKTKAAVLTLDLEDKTALAAKAKQAWKIFGEVDILVNNAGVSQRGKALDTDIEVDEKIINTNYLGTITLSKSILPMMLAKNSGQLVTITSVLGKFGAPTRSSYSASKHALHGFFDSLRAELYPQDITITLICPGYIKTNISLNALAEDGSRHGKLDKGQAQGLPAEECARRILRAISKRKDEAYIGGKEIGGIYLKRFFPGLWSKIIRRLDIS